MKIGAPAGVVTLAAGVLATATIVMIAATAASADSPSTTIMGFTWLVPGRTVKRYQARKPPCPRWASRWELAGPPRGVSYAWPVKRTGSPRVSFLGAALVGSVLFALNTGSGSAKATTNAKSRTVYSVASAVQFLNNADDLARGQINNPFNAATNKLQPKSTTVAGGQTLPGDVALFSFTLYENAALKKGAGTATYTCYFNYAQRALCRAYYEFRSGGTVLAAGPVDFNKKGFSMVVTGGTNEFFGARGEVTAVPAARNAQRVALLLLH